MHATYFAEVEAAAAAAAEQATSAALQAVRDEHTMNETIVTEVSDWRVQ